MLIMSWLYTQKGGNGLLVEEYVRPSAASLSVISNVLCSQYPLLKKWADYLVQNALRPTAL